MTAKNTAGTTVSMDSPEAVTKAAAMLNSYVLTVNRYAIRSSRSSVNQRAVAPTA